MTLSRLTLGFLIVAPGSVAFADESEPWIRGLQPDCAWREHFEFSAPVDEGGGVMSRLDSIDISDLGARFSTLTVVACTEGDWISAEWDDPTVAPRLLEQLRDSSESIEDMGDEFAATKPTFLRMGQDLRELPGFGLERCGCDIHYDTDFGRFGASSR